jgi:hypothetical protein
MAYLASFLVARFLTGRANAAPDARFGAPLVSLSPERTDFRVADAEARRVKRG